MDCAVSGNTTSSLLDRFYSTVLNQEFDWVVLFIGTNDCRQLDDPAHSSEISPEEYRRNMEYLTGRFVERGNRIALVTLPPVDKTRLRAYFPEANSCYDPARLETTNRYAEITTRTKEDALRACEPQTDSSPGYPRKPVWRDDETLLSWLDSL